MTGVQDFSIAKITKISKPWRHEAGGLVTKIRREPD
jgi:hypothetical protein